MTEFLSFENLTGGYGDTLVVFDISATVYAGQALGVFGRNGVGKTTLARLLQGSLQAKSGTISIDTRSVEQSPSFARRQRGLGYMPQTGMVFDDLTVRENLSLGTNNGEVEDYFDLFPTLAERLDQKAGSMSGGERKILAFVRAMLEDTRIVILDEPSEGVQPENISRMEWCLKDRKKHGGSIILIEQNLSLLTSVTDDLLGLDSGRTVLQKPLSATTREQMLEVLSI
jgi:ABC-type branched-subunit amino acid transport system ATPase component